MKRLAVVLSFFLLTIGIGACAMQTGNGENTVVAAQVPLTADPGPKADMHTTYHVHGNATTAPAGLSPAQIRMVYGLPSSGGVGTVAIIDAYDCPSAEKDLNTFSAQFGLPACTTANGCFKKVMLNKPRADQGWCLEVLLDTQRAHAIAPNAKILLVEAKTASISDLLAAVDYAARQIDVVSDSMSWGGAEFASEAAYDYHFVSPYGATFFASSGDSGTGASWPCSSPNVVGVGGTSLAFNADGSLASETAWSGSGGGVSAYQPMPGYQSAYGVVTSTGKRAIPDVSYDADPASGFSVYDSYGYQGQKGWFRVGGTSAGAPQWAAIRALGTYAITPASFYADATSSYAAYFRDVTSGTNGSCGTNCTAVTGYDLVTGLGSPLTTTF